MHAGPCFVNVMCPCGLLTDHGMCCRGTGEAGGGPGAYGEVGAVVGASATRSAAAMAAAGTLGGRGVVEVRVVGGEGQEVEVVLGAVAALASVPGTQLVCC